jgi:hypothetical protein
MARCAHPCVMNSKRKGTRNEDRSRTILEATGYTVTRAAGLKDAGALDLLRRQRCARSVAKSRKCAQPTCRDRFH